MSKLSIPEVHKLWNTRAAEYPKAATTFDIHLRELEALTLIEYIKRSEEEIHIRHILDAGCGDGQTTLKLAKASPDIAFIGWDYSEQMLELAEQNAHREGIRNVKFVLADVLKDSAKVDVTITCRTLINITDKKLQYEAFDHLCGTARRVIMIENFIREQETFEALRARVGLPVIKVHDHNLYFDEEELEYYTLETLGVDTFTCGSFANAYYYATRIVYALSCQAEGVTPDYNHPIHRTAINLPEIHEVAIAPMKLIIA